MISCKQSASSEQSQMPDLSEFKKVEESTSKTNQTAKPAAREEVTVAKESNATKVASARDKAEISSRTQTKKATVKTKPKTTSKPKTQAKPKVTQRPQIQFDKPVHEFGEITEGDIIKHEFAFKNTGKAELVIKSAKASCGCTNPSYPFIGIAPGETGFIGVTYNSVSKEGTQKPEVTIKTNVDDTSIVLYLSGVVLPKEEAEEKKEEEGN